MNQGTLPTALAGARELGIVGARQLHAAQVIDIGRLTSHVVPVIPGTFVAITGRGPKGDSNNSGKRRIWRRSRFCSATRSGSLLQAASMPTRCCSTRMLSAQLTSGSTPPTTAM